MKKLIFFIILSVILFSQTAHAIGISPARVIVDSEPGLERSFIFNVINRGSSQVIVKTYVRGDLAEYISLDQDKIILPAGQTKSFGVDIKLPQELEPGTHDNRIGAVESLEGVESQGTMVGAVTGVEAQLWIRVPYPGFYATASLNVPDAKIGEPVVLTVSVTNLGKNDISSAKASIDIYDSENRQVVNVKTDEKEIKVGQTAELTAIWEPTDAGAGVYKAKASVNYNGNYVDAEASFRIGELLINIVDIPVTEIIEGEIGKFSIEIESMWNEKISGVYATADILDAGNNVIKTFKTESVDITPWDKKTIIAYIDATDLEVGEYNIRVTLHYAEKTTEKIASLKIVEKTLSMFLPILLIGGILLAAIIIVLITLRKVF